LEHRFKIFRDDWGLFRKGSMDYRRHRKKLADAAEKNLLDEIEREEIVIKRGKKPVKISVNLLKEYGFRFDSSGQLLVGQGWYDVKKDIFNGDSSGDVKGYGAGDGTGLDNLGEGLQIEDFEYMQFKGWELPDLKKKNLPQNDCGFKQTFELKATAGLGCLDRRRTLLANMKRNALKGAAVIGGFEPHDFWYKVPLWKEDRFNAVVISILDMSGSMGIYEMYLARMFFFLMLRFLRIRYSHAEIIFLAHDTEARQVSEGDFFTREGSGGTKCSSAYDLALKLIQTQYSPDLYNIYGFHLSDGDNLPLDNYRCLCLVKRLLKHTRRFGYGEVVKSGARPPTLIKAFKSVDSPSFFRFEIKNKAQVYRALKTFFSPHKT